MGWYTHTDTYNIKFIDNILGINQSFERFVGF